MGPARLFSIRQMLAMANRRAEITLDADMGGRRSAASVERFGRVEDIRERANGTSRAFGPAELRRASWK
jgi:hypothetical protein